MSDDTTVDGMKLMHDARVSGVDLPIDAWSSTVAGITVAIPESGPDAGVLTLMLLARLPGEAGMVFVPLHDTVLDQQILSRRVRDEERDRRRRGLT